MMIKEEAAEDISSGGRGLPRRTIAASQRMKSDEEGRRSVREADAAEMEGRGAKQGVTRGGGRGEMRQDAVPSRYTSLRT